MSPAFHLYFTRNPLRKRSADVHIHRNRVPRVPAANGEFILIDYPGAAVTSAVKINPQGDVVGWYGAGAGSPLRGY